MSKEKIRCLSCGFRIRGKKHEEGSHHFKHLLKIEVKMKGTNKHERI